MNQNQQRYAMQRVSQVLARRTTELRKKFTKTPKEVTDEQKLSAIYDGDVLLKRNMTLATTLREAYDFRRLRPEAIENLSGSQRALADLNDMAAAVRDEIMLGNETKALKLLHQFCNE
jgi:hypothetical protein